MNEVLGAPALLGLLFGLGALITISGIRSAPDLGLITRISRRKYLEEFLFVQGLIFAILGSAVAAIALGYLTRSAIISLLGLVVGAYAGQHIFKIREKNKANETALRLKLYSGGFLDLVGLSISCGFSLRSGIGQAVKWSSPEVERIWSPLLSDEEANQSLSSHLELVSSENRTNTMGRISRTLLISLERGTPVSQTLRSLSAEIRSETRRELLEIAARKEVAMMVPVVFGILPSVTIIALYPAFVSLSIM